MDIATLNQAKKYANTQITSKMDAIDTNHFFADDTARDAYFTSHPTEKVTGVLVSSNDVYQLYNGSSWVTKTPVSGVSKFEFDAIIQDADIIVTVGTGGDFATINEAIQYLSRKRLKQGYTATIQLLTGFAMSEQVLIDGLDLGWITITSVDATVTINRAGLTATMITLPTYGNYSAVITKAAFNGNNNAVLPVIDVLFTMDATDIVESKYAFFMANGAQIKINKDKGCTYASHGLYATQGGKIYAMGANVSNAIYNAISCFRGGYVSCGGGNGSYAGVYGIYADVNSVAEVSGQSDFSYAGTTGIKADGCSSVSATDINISHAGTYGIEVANASRVNAKSGNLDDAGDYGVVCGGASSVDVASASIKNAGNTGIVAVSGGVVNAQSATLTGAVTYTLWAYDGGYISARSALAQKVVGTDNADMRISAGGQINASGATGGIYDGLSPNIPTTAGVIYTSSALTSNAYIGADLTVTLANSWEGTLTYSKTPQGIVWIRGTLTAGTLDDNTNICGATLNAGYRPPVITVFPVYNSTTGAVCHMHLSSSGNIYLSEAFSAGTINVNVMYKV